MDYIRRWLVVFVAAILVGAPAELSAQVTDAPAEPTEPAAEEPAAEAPAAEEPAAEEPVAAPVAEEPAPAPEPDVSGSVGVSLGAQVDTETGAEVDAAADAEAAAGAADTDSDDVEEIVVTGSRIKRNSFDTPTPVQVYNRDDILRSGATNMADLIRFMTANSGSSTQFGLGQGSAGSSNFNLRGLGLANTLVLVNGRRLVPFPDTFGVTNSASFSDVNQIPLQFIERIEIAKGGASAIYGSDAIAGVVNIILRKDYEGFGVSVNGQTTDGWDQQDGEVAVIFGANSDDSSIVAQFSYFGRAPLAANERDYTAGTLSSAVGQPGTYILLGARPDLPAGVGPVGVMTDPGCGQPGTSSFLNEALDRCRFSFRDDWNLFNDEERILGYVQAEHRVADALRFFGEAGFARRETRIPQSPSLPVLRSVVIPPDHLANPFGAPAVFLGRPLGRAAGSAKQQINVDGFRALGGISGDLDGAGMTDWTYEAAFTWHMNQHLRRNADILFDRFQETVNSCNDPSDLSRCFNPFHSAIDGTGIKNSAEVIDYMNGQLKNLNTTEMLVGDLSFAGPLFALPGGDLSLAIGGQVRRNTQSTENDNDSDDQAYAFIIGTPDWEGSQNVVAGFAELALPILQGAEIQAAVRAEHYEDIETSVNPRVGMSWTLGETFVTPAVLEKFRLRGSIGTAFRAPNVTQTAGSVTNLQQFADPGTVFRGVTTSPNPDLKPEKSLAFSAGFEWLFEGLTVDVDYWQYQVTDLIVLESAQSLVRNCRAEMAAGGDGTLLSDVCPDEFEFTAGTDNWQRTFVSYNNQDEITTSGLDFVLGYRRDFGSGGVLSLSVGGTYTFNYVVPATQVPVLSVANPDYDEDAAMAAMEAGEAYDVPETVPQAQEGCDGLDADGKPIGDCNLAGKRNVNNFAQPLPQLRMRIPLSWSLDGHVASLAVNYIGGYDDDANYNNVSGELDGIDTWVTLDLSYGYMLGEWAAGSETALRVGVNNLLGSDPPLINNANFGYDIFTHDPRGRLIYANLMHKF